MKQTGRLKVKGWALSNLLPFVTGLGAGLLATSLFALSLPSTVAAAPGDLDPTFGSGGLVTTDFGRSELAFAVALQPDGKIVTAGVSFDPSNNDGDFALARYNADGTLDVLFGTGGKVITVLSGGTSFDAISGVVVQPDGRIVVAGGSANFLLVRYNADGSLDTSFGIGGRVSTGFSGIEGAHALIVQPDNKIVVAGSDRPVGTSNNDFALARYNPDGSLDLTFGVGGKVIRRV